MILSETEPIVLLKKYRSLLASTAAVELVDFIISLTDSLIAANLVSAEALSAIKLFSPFLLISSFFSAILNSGTLLNYSLEIGRVHKKRADEFFSQGIILTVICGILMTAAVLLITPLFLSAVSISPEIETYFTEYYTIAAFYLLLIPVSCVLNNIVVADGGEKFATFANIFCIIGNIVLSLILAGSFGVVGIAFASLAGKASFVLFICLWFFNRNNHVRFVFHFAWTDFLSMAGCGIVRASKYAATSLMLGIINLFILQNYDIETFEAWAVAQNLIYLSTFFFGISMILQPLIGILRGENNTKAIRILVWHLSRDLALISAVCAMLLLVFAPQIFHAFGIRDGAAFLEGVTALRITGWTIMLSAQMELFFVYYFLINKKLLAVDFAMRKELICPVGLVLLLGLFHVSSTNILWSCLAASVVLAAVLSIIIVSVRYPRSVFPLLLPHEQDDRIHIYGFGITPGNAAAISETARNLLQKEGFSERLQTLVGVCLEDMINLIMEHNPGSAKDLSAECTFITEDDGVQVILRDDGKIFDITEESAKDYSFLRYTVERMITVTDHNAYITTTGYNRNELFFGEKRMASE